MCTQRDITVPLSARGKYAQDGVPFTKSHNKRYFRRDGVERGYAKDKDRAQAGIQRGDIRTMGKTKIGFLLAVHHGARNLADARTGPLMRPLRWPLRWPPFSRRTDAYPGDGRWSASWPRFGSISFPGI